MTVSSCSTATVVDVVVVMMMVVINCLSLISYKIFVIIRTDTIVSIDNNGR